jgi:LysM repeat protein
VKIKIQQEVKMKKYKVKKGDTLRRIAILFYNDPNKYIIIAEENDIKNPNNIKVGQVLTIPEEITSSIISRKGRKKYTSLTKYHRAFAGGIRWRLTKSGLEIEDSGIERSKGSPKTVTRIWNNYNKEINKWAKHFGVPCVLIIATIATESSGRATSRREEPGFISDTATPHRVSVGLMQTLISTARSTLYNEKIDSKWLKIPSNSIEAGTCYIAEQFPITNFDPPKVACAYNSGGLYKNRGKKNRWKMRQYPIGTSKHCDRFVKWFNDAVFVLEKHPKKAKVTYSVLF